jgi:hypothetical protein
MNSHTFWTTSTGTPQLWTVPVDQILRGAQANTGVVISNDPKMTYEIATTPTATFQKDEMLIVVEATQPKDQLFFPLAGGQQVFVCFATGLGAFYLTIYTEIS